MNTVNKIVLAIREAINAVKSANPDQSVTDGFSVAVFENDNGEFTAEVFFGVDNEKTVWYGEMTSFDDNIQNVKAFLENSDGCRDDLMNIAHSFISEDWIQTI